MILFDTPYEQAIKIMLSEWEKVGYVVQKNEHKIRKLFEKMEPGKVHIHTYKYTVPASNNTYYIISKRDYNDNINTWTYLKADGDLGKRKFFVLRKNIPEKEDVEDILEKPVWILDVYTGHFLSRYRERTGNPNSGVDELFVHYLQQNNSKGMAIPAYLVNPNIDQNDKTQYAVVSDEGMAFIESTECKVCGALAHINENKTFVSKSNLFYEQAVSILSADFFVKRARLIKAKKEGASPEKLVKILNSGFFEPTKKH